MHERIKKLAEQAFRDTVLCGGKRGDKDFDQLYNERFAELIVAECIDIVAAGGEFASRPKLVEKLQEHFGVEE